MAIKVNKELNEVIALISNIFETFTTAYYEFSKDDNSLNLVSHYSLSQHIKNKHQIKLKRNFFIWIKDFKKPISIKDSYKGEYSDLLNIYKKLEPVKCFYTVLVGKERGILYVDTKKTYAFHEKEQKLLHHCANLIELLLKIRDSAIDIKETINYTEMAKMIKLKVLGSKSRNFNITSLINVLSEELQFDFGTLIINEFSQGFKISATNEFLLNDLIGRPLDVKNSIIGSFLNNMVKMPKFVEIKEREDYNNFFTKFEKVKRDSIKNFLYFPFETGTNLIGAFIFFNFRKSFNFKKLCYYLYDILYPFVYEHTIKEHINFLVRKEPVTGFLRSYYFFTFLENDNFKDCKVIFIKNTKFHFLVKKHSLNTVLKTYKELKRNMEKILNKNIEGVLISLDKILFLVSDIRERDFISKINIITKAFKNRSIKVENIEVNIDIHLTFFSSLLDKKKDILKICY